VYFVLPLSEYSAVLYNKMAEVTKFTFKDIAEKKPHELISAQACEFEGGRKAMRIEAKKGFHWTKCMKEKMGTDYCQAEHFGFVEKGHMKVSMGENAEGGKTVEIKGGDVYFIPPNHDAVIMEDAVMYEFSALAVSMYGK